MEDGPSGGAQDDRGVISPAGAAVPLSTREREVLALVAAGLTNRGISERLVISLGTADRHVHNILAKLGCNNRTEAAAFASVPQADVPRTLGPPGASIASPSDGPFVGRAYELQRAADCLREAKAGHGSLAMVVGEPGIGKTRLIEEAARQAGADGFTVLWGRCYEGDWAPPYVPFAEALTALVRRADLRELRADLGFGGPPLARISPVIRERLPDLPEPASLGPNEEQFRILDAVVQLLRATANRRPMLLVIDDLHWADSGTLNMLRYVSRFLSESRICLLTSYRDVELDRGHLLGETVAELRRSAGYERITLRGLAGVEVAEMLESIAGYHIAEKLADAICAETDGNPLFVREMLLHLMEEGSVVKGGEEWTAARSLAIPEGIRHVIGRRLSRLNDEGHRLLTTASAFNGPFRFDVAAEAAEVEEGPALEAVDAAINAQLIQACGKADTYEFSHALIAHTLYSELNPSRQVRVHRRIARALETKLPAPAAEIAYQYHRSATLPGADAGIAWALLAADEAATAYAWEKVVSLCEVGLELMQLGDPRRDESIGRLGLALPCLRRCDEAIAAIKVWAGSLFSQGRIEAGLEYLMLGHRALVGSGFEWEGFELAHFAEPHLLGLDHRASVWFRLLLLRDAEESSPDYVGLTLGTPEKVELFRAWDALPNLEDTTVHRSGMRTYASRAEVLAWPRTYPLWGTWATFQAGEFREAEAVLAERAAIAIQRGELDEAAQQIVFRAACHISLGNFALARELLADAASLAGGAPNSGAALTIAARNRDFVIALDVGWEALDVAADQRLARGRFDRHKWAAAPFWSAAARAKARLGRADRALELLRDTLPAIERCPGGAGNYQSMIGNLALVLWDLENPTFADVLETNLRAKVIALDFRCPMFDGRLSLAQVCTLQGRIDEARDWFADAREVLDEQGARPLRAICDYDEALALVRHSRKTGSRLDLSEVRGLLAVAASQFEEIGMPGWLERSRTLNTEVG